MAEFFFRTEDIKPDEVLHYFVETRRDREIINELKARNPVVLAGSRGVGKSFLLRVAEAELQASFAQARVCPVYVTFSKSSLINTTDPRQFQHWMLARVCSRLARTLVSMGLSGTVPTSLSILTGDDQASPMPQATRIERITAEFEESWKRSPGAVDVAALPSVDAFRDAIEDVCTRLSIARLIVLIDEAAHIFLPEQQRQFFTLFRDLRSPYLSCKAAVYPGVTVYGDTFQPFHDATMLSLDRDPLDETYISNMREIAERQAESGLIEDIARHGQNFAVLAYAASGNPRVMLKTLGRAKRVGAQQVNEIIREYYRSDIWSEHSTLPEKYPGHRALIDWGRQFIEADVLPDLQKKNIQYLEAERKSTCYFWVHRDAPQQVKESLRLLAYTGIVSEHASGIKATRGEIGTRYAVNLGCLFALESSPAATAFQIASNLTPRRMSEYGANHGAFQTLLVAMPSFDVSSASGTLERQLGKPVGVLDITDWQMESLMAAGMRTVGDVLHASEAKLQELYYVGQVRSRRMRNAALAAVYEYLSG